MKPKNNKKILLTIVALFCLSLLNAQNLFPSGGSVGIGTTSPNSSAILDIDTVGKGILIPRMTKSQRDAIISPVTGLLIYQTNSTPGFYYNTGSNWTALKISDYWKIDGNTFTGSPTTKKFGPKSCTALQVITYDTIRLEFMPACFAASGKSSATFQNTDTIYFNGVKSVMLSDSTQLRVGGILIGDEYATGSCLLAKPSNGSTNDGFKMKSFPDSGKAVLVVEATSPININCVAIRAFSLPSLGYGTAINAQGGRYGVFAVGRGGAHTLNSVYGLYGNAVGLGTIGTTRIGTYGRGDSASLGYGIYGEAGVACLTTRAGYFSGDLQYTGSLIGPSDLKLKENIQVYTGALDQLKMLKVKSYNFKNEYDFMHLGTDKQIGLISQELEEIFPELVKESVHPARYDDATGQKTNDEVRYKGVNYLGLIPVLIEGVNEQQQQIEELKKYKNDITQLRNENIALKNQLAEIQKTLTRIVSGDSKSLDNGKPALEQNVPNPFTDKTVIRYHIPQYANKGSINIYTADHVLLNSYPVAPGRGQLTIEAGVYASGTYFYELIVDDVTVESQKMNITK